MDLSVVLLSYNTRDLLEQALRTVFDAAAGLEVEVLVVDNASHDGSPEMVAEKFPQAKLIRSPENLGFAAGNNLALRRVCGRYVLLLNSDTVVRQDTLGLLVGFMDAHPEAGAAGCKILNPDGTLQLACRRGFPTPTAALCKLSGLSRLFPHSPRIARYNLTYLDPEQTNEVDALSGSCIMVRKQAMDQVGLLDEDYFFFGEDLDWCFRIREAGWKIYYVSGTEIIHFQGESSRVEEMRLRYRFYEAMSIFVRKHMRRRYRFFPLWLLHAGIVLYGSLSFLVRLGRRLGLPLLDAAVVLAGIKLGLVLRYHSRLAELIRTIERTSGELGLEAHPTRWLKPPPYSDSEWFLVYAVSTSIWVLALYGMGLYDRHRFAALRAVVGVALGFAGVVTMVFFFKAYNFSRLAAAAAWGFNTLMVAGWRLGASRLAQTGRGRRLTRRRALLVGTDEAAVQFLEYLQGLADFGDEVVGLVGQRAEWRGRSVAGRPVIGLAEELPQLVREYKIDELIFTSNTISHVIQKTSGWRRRPLRVRMVPGSFAGLVEGQAPASLEALPLIEISPGR